MNAENAPAATDHATASEHTPSTGREPLTFRVGLVGAFIAPVIFLVGVIAYFVIYGVFDMNALTASGLVGVLVAALFARSYGRFWDWVIAGVSSRTSITLLLILLSVSLMSALISQTDVAGGFVWLAGQIGIGGGGFVAVVFLMVCAIAMSTGSSIGTLFTAFPIFYPAGVVLGADPLLLAGAILSGALFGDNLAPISDSTIVSASTQRYRRRSGVAEIGGVVRSRAKYALTAAAISTVLFLVLGLALAGDGGVAQVGGADNDPLSLVMLVPVAILLLTAFWKRDIFLATTVGLLSGIVVGLLAGLLSPADIISANEDDTAGGFLVAGIADILPLIGLGIVVFSIIGIFQGAGIFDRIVDAAARSRLTNTPRGTELVMGLGAALTAGVFAGVNGPSMLMYGPVADRVGSRVGLHPYRRANVMDCFTLGIGSVVPVVSSFLLIAGLLTQGYGDGVPALSPVAIFTTAFYPLVLTVVILVAILTGWGRSFEGEDGAETKDPQPTPLP